jgi:cysteinyl-tRNA synthetase
MIRGAFDDDLDTVAALDLLRSVESRQDIAAGAKYETFLFVDRVPGLELPSEIGRRPAQDDIPPLATAALPDRLTPGSLRSPLTGPIRRGPLPLRAAKIHKTCFTWSACCGGDGL